MRDLHDWTLLSINFEWKEARAAFVFQWGSENYILIAKGVRDLRVVHLEEWGPSVSVNTVRGPLEIAGGVKKLTVEMQSGDEITLTAADFWLELA